MKKIIFLLIIVISLFFIYKTNNKTIDYFDLGDSISLGINSYGNKTYGYNDYIKVYLDNNNLLNKYNNYFSKNNYKINELVSDIKNNKNILYNNKIYNLKKELRESDLLTISIGMDELIELLNSKKYNDVNNLIKDMDNLLINIKLYAKNKIVLIGYYNPYGNSKELERIYANISDKYSILCNKYNVYYVDIYNLINSDKALLPNKNDYHLVSKGYLKISNEIIKKVFK